jgi:hypothetical protein
VGKLTREGVKNERLFNLLHENLEKLKTEKSLKNLRENFIKQILILLGFWPRGKPIVNPDRVLEEVTERELSSIRIGKKLVE